MKSKQNQIPTVPLTKFLKHSLEILKNPLPFHHNNFERLGDTFRLKIGFKNSVVFSRDAAFLQYVLQKNQRNYTKSKIQTEDLAKYVGKGLLTSEGTLWKQQRKLIQPAFHKKQLANLLGTMHKTIAAELQKIETGKPFEISSVFSDLAFQVVAKSLFSGGVSEAQIKRLQHITEEAQKMLVRELRQPYLHWWFILSGVLQKHINLTHEARSILKQLVADRKKSGVREDDLLDMLLDARYEDGNAMDEEQLIDEILILFTAGHETTSNSLTFTTQLLAKHPEYQEQIFNETQKAEAETNDLMELLRKVPITTRVIEESLRLYPPAYFIDRVNIEADEFSGMRFEKGTSLLFAVHEIHKSETHWEHPLQFNPNRFANKNYSDYASFYYPFGAGPRMCIGNNFAMYEMVLAVSTLCKTFGIAKKNDAIEINPLITLKPKNAILRFEKR
ncbi:cytochrome P450 [Rasiella sp. SM2506]|uniref:cytochrome P450 n=1 Tax=Rasiella sp. SM2506 TaxID=3423914 RepID=UPI003D78B5D8